MPALLLASMLMLQPAPYDAVEQYVYDRWEAEFPGEGTTAVAVIRCEGWNATANWDITHISPTSDVGPFQINQIHGRTGGIIAGRWPGAVQTLAGNVDAALALRRQSPASNPFRDWFMSAHCWRNRPAAPPAGGVSTVVAVPIVPPTPAPTPTTQPTPTATVTPAPVFEVLEVTHATPTTTPTIQPTPTATVQPIQPATRALRTMHTVSAKTALTTTDQRTTGVTGADLTALLLLTAVGLPSLTTRKTDQ